MLDKVKTAVKAFLSLKWSKKCFVQDVYILSVRGWGVVVVYICVCVCIFFYMYNNKAVMSGFVGTV